MNLIEFQRTFHGSALVTYDFRCACGTEERTIRRRNVSTQVCAKGHGMERLLTGCAKQDIMQGYPYKHATLNDMEIRSPGHFKDVLRAKGLEVKHKGNGWN